MINLKLKEIELDRFNANFSETDVNNYIKLITKKNTNELKQIFSRNDLDFNLFLNEIKTELKWRQFIFNTYSSRLDINLDNIDKEVKNILKNQSKIVEFKLSEIELILDDINEYDSKVADIKKRIEELGFEKAALKFSTSETKINNGDLGWVNTIHYLKKYIQFKNLKGSVSKPVIRGKTLTL